MRSRARPRPARKVPWGWLELVGVAQYAMPALMFLPFVVGPLRTATRVVGFSMAFLAWAADPRLEERKRMGLLVLGYILITAVLLGLAKRRIWRDVH